MNLPHVLTQDLELTPVLVTKDILEMERLVKVKNNYSDQEQISFILPISDHR